MSGIPNDARYATARRARAASVWQRRYDALLAVAPELVLRLRRDGRYLEYRPSPQFPAISSPGKVLGHTVQEILPPDVAGVRMATVERALASGHVETCQYELVTADTRRVREERHAACGPSEVIVTVRDVTEYRKIGETVEALQEELRSLFENVPDCVAMLAPDGTLLFVNRAAPGVSREAVIGTIIYDQVAPRDHAKVRAAMERTVSTGHSSSFDVALVGPLCAEGRYACRLGAVAHEGRVAGLTLVARDVTERERVLEALRESEQRYRGLVAGSRDPIFITTCDGQVVDFNQAALDLFGYTRAELPGVNVGQLYVDVRDRDRFRAEIERNGSVRDYEVKLRRKDGTRLIGLLTATVRTAKDGTIIGYQGILRDVTQRRRLEREVLESTEREQRRIGQDLHDGLGQHLTGVAFLSKVLAEKLAAEGMPQADDAAKIESLVNEAVSQTRRLAKGLQPIALDKGGLGVALQEMCLHATQLFGIPCSCRLVDEPSLNDSGAATHVYHIAREAVHNAVKHSKARSIRVELSTVEDAAILSIQDDGIGVHHAGKNSDGLGLKIMRYRAGMVGGSLEVRATPGHGTLVQCRFPVSGTRSPGRAS